MPLCLHEMALRGSQRPDSPPRRVAFGRGPPGGGIRAGESRGILQALLGGDRVKETRSDVQVGCS